MVEEPLVCCMVVEESDYDHDYMVGELCYMVEDHDYYLLYDGGAKIYGEGASYGVEGLTLWWRSLVIWFYGGRARGICWRSQFIWWMSLIRWSEAPLFSGKTR